LAGGFVGASIGGSTTGLRRPTDTLPVRGSASLRLVEITRALRARLRLREDARPFDDDAMPGSSPSTLTWQLSRLQSRARPASVSTFHALGPRSFLAMVVDRAAVYWSLSGKDELQMRNIISLLASPSTASWRIPSGKHPSALFCPSGRHIHAMTLRLRGRGTSARLILF
jgi:hypothetical protein